MKELLEIREKKVSDRIKEVIDGLYPLKIGHISYDKCKTAISEIVTEYFSDKDIGYDSHIIERAIVHSGGFSCYIVFKFKFGGRFLTFSKLFVFPR